ncbi:trigger factor [Campylobacterota bacterium]|nr:trigger factor [Campylobacterota bacterium]
MQVSVKKIDSANALISASFSKDEIAKAQDKAAAKVAKNVKIDGFRKGMVPTTLVKSRYGEQITKEANEALSLSAFEDGLKELDSANTIGLPTIKTLKNRDDGGLDLEIHATFRPQFDLGDYLSIVPTHEPFSVTEEEVAKSLQQAADNTAEVVELDEKRPLVIGDIAEIDFQGYREDGTEMDEARAQGYRLLVGKSSLIAGFEDHLIGMQNGETKEFSLKFPDDYHAADIAGKNAKFVVTLIKLLKQQIPVAINDETAKKLLPSIENPTVETLTNAVKQSILNDKKGRLYTEELRPKLLTALTDRYNFDLPSTIVEKEIDYLGSQKARSMPSAELEKLVRDDDALKIFRETFRIDAEARVKATLVIDAIAKAENIKISDQEVVQAIYREALSTGADPKQMLEQYKNANLTAIVRMALTEDRVLTALLEKKNGVEKDAK